MTGPIPTELSFAESLYQLLLNDNSMTGNLDILSSIPGLEVIDLSSNSFSSTLADGISDIEGLKEFMVDENELTGTVPEEFVKLTNLEILLIQNNNIEGSLADDICDLRENSSNNNGGKLLRFELDCIDKIQCPFNFLQPDCCTRCF